jgi:hypothetical protein
MKPATDIFISSQQMVASIVVLPLMYGEQNLGGLYFTLETPSNFQNIKDMLMGFVNSIVLVLLQKLEGQLHQMWDVVVQVRLWLQRGAAAAAAAGWGGPVCFVPPEACSCKPSLLRILSAGSTLLCNGTQPLTLCRCLPPAACCCSGRWP